MHVARTLICTFHFFRYRFSLCRRLLHCILDYFQITVYESALRRPNNPSEWVKEMQKQKKPHKKTEQPKTFLLHAISKHYQWSFHTAFAYGKWSNMPIAHWMRLWIVAVTTSAYNMNIIIKYHLSTCIRGIFSWMRPFSKILNILLLFCCCSQLHYLFIHSALDILDCVCAHDNGAYWPAASRQCRCEQIASSALHTSIINMHIR